MSNERGQLGRDVPSLSGLGSPEPASSHQEFSAFMREFIGQVGAKIVVEVGADAALERAALIAPVCKRYYAVTLPEDTDRMQGFHEFLGDENIEIITGNAVSLSEMIPHADVIILHNVLLDLTGNDTAQMWSYRRGEKEFNQADWDRLIANFTEAKLRAYREFLKIARPGHIVTFQRKEMAGRERAFITQTLGVPSDRVREQELLYDGTLDLWTAYIIDSA